MKGNFVIKIYKRIRNDCGIKNNFSQFLFQEFIDDALQVTLLGGQEMTLVSCMTMRLQILLVPSLVHTLLRVHPRL